jgi:hypothetical protein
MNQVYGELFSCHGNQIQVRPAASRPGPRRGKPRPGPGPSPGAPCLREHPPPTHPGGRAGRQAPFHSLLTRLGPAPAAPPRVPPRVTGERAPQVHRADDYIDFADGTAETEGVSFWELAHLASAAGSVALGYLRIHRPGGAAAAAAAAAAAGGLDPSESAEVVLNPRPKEARILWRPDDPIIVICESQHASTERRRQAAGAAPVPLAPAAAAPPPGGGSGSDVGGSSAEASPPVDSGAGDGAGGPGSGEEDAGYGLESNEEVVLRPRP